jgi:hypothetical protein
MPICEDRGRPVLRCVNNHWQELNGPQRDPHTGQLLPPKTTMVTPPDWAIIPSRFVESHATPVQIYICRVCGYVELYAVPSIKPPEEPREDPLEATAKAFLQTHYHWLCSTSVTKDVTFDTMNKAIDALREALKERGS